MGKPKNYNLPEVLNATNIGLIFEFYSSKDTNFIVENLSKLTTKSIMVTNAPTYAPQYSKAILIKEYEGKKPRYSFHMAQQRYDSMIPLMKEVLNWIKETAECNVDTLMRVNLSFDHKHLKTLSSVSLMDTNKLILKIDEEYIYQRFPEQENSPYAFSVKQLMPITEAAYNQNMVKNINYIVGTPKQSYYGINFKDYSRGNLEFNYIGGTDYAENQDKIMEVLNYYVIKTFQSLNEVEYTKDEIKQLEIMTEDYYKIQEAYYDPTMFPKLFPDIRVMVDMNTEEQLIKSFWPKIRNNLFECVVNNKLRKGQFNYDTDIAQYQLRNADINCTGIARYDLVKCRISGVIEECNLIACEVHGARVYNSKIVRNNTISESYLNRVTADKENNLEFCFVENNHEMINCNIKSSILKFAGLGRSAKLDESSTIVDNADRLQQPVVGVEVEEIRDYKWFKSLSGIKDESENVYGNEYIRPKYIK